MKNYCYRQLRVTVQFLAKKVRVANAAEIITSEEAYQRSKLIESEKQVTEENKIKRKQQRENKKGRLQKKIQKRHNSVRLFRR